VREIAPYFLRTKFPDIAQNSLFFEIFSLIICLGNCARNRCSTAVSCVEPGAQGPRIAKFPVKFPVSREFAWRRVRSALRRQPATRSTRGGLTLVESTAFYRVFVRLPRVSGLQKTATLTRICRKSPAQTAEIPIFRGDDWRRPVRSPLSGRDGSCIPAICSLDSGRCCKQLIDQRTNRCVALPDDQHPDH